MADETESKPAEAEAEVEAAAGTGDDADKLAAEWEAMAGGDGDGDEAQSSGLDTQQSARVLNQDEIDSLLGFDPDSANGADKSGIRAVVNSALVSYERLPMLEVIFDRLVRLLTTSMRNFTSDNVEVSLDSMTSVRFGDYLNSVPLPAMLTVFKADIWDAYGLITTDSSLIYSIVDILLGGRRGTAALRIEGRPYTTIERNLVERMIHLVLDDMNAAFEPISPVSFLFDRLETNPRFAAIARPANAIIVARLRVDMEDRGGKMDIVLPYATLEPVREILLQMFMGEKFGRDNIWENHLAGELWQTSVEIEAVLDEITMPLGEMVDLKVGTLLPFRSGPDNDIQLRCGGVPLFMARMGRRHGNIALQIRDVVKSEDE
ncbi:MAG: flagellar motor switch protein FliM [Alphaproteobacteria bacterium]